MVLTMTYQIRLLLHSKGSVRSNYLKAVDLLFKNIKKAKSASLRINLKDY